MAPAPYFPSRNPIFGRYADFARIPASKTRLGVEVLHPRYLVAPKIGSRLAPWTLYRAGLRAARALQAEGAISMSSTPTTFSRMAWPPRRWAGRFEVAGRHHRTRHGPDADPPRPDRAHRGISWAAQEAAACVAVCEDLRQRLVRSARPKSGP
jgi:teichuronic acid biosynthesis glycosyltransferase TuaC